MRHRINFCIHLKCSIELRENLAQFYHFDELCDNIVNRKLFPIGSNKTDCEYWPLECHTSPYTRCNRIWNCKNGLDEIDCPTTNSDDIIRNSFHCNKNEHYCIQLNNLTCIHLNRTGDGIIDCIGGIDERLTSICQDKYPLDLKRRFYCLNSSICIRIDQVCNRIIDCPQGDDELICPWLFKSNISKFHCKNSLLSIDRCDLDSSENWDCQFKEQLWFCDLERFGINDIFREAIRFEQYPKIDENIQSISFENIKSEKRTYSLINYNCLCNKGYSIESFGRKSYCLCPPSYYDDYCQYQSERLTLLIKIQFQYDINPSLVYRLIIHLLDENNQTISNDEIVYNRQFNSDDDPDKFLVYLMYKRMINVSLYERSKSKYVRIDSYIIKEANVQYISSWLFHVLFPFLPVNRLVVLIELEDESFQIWKCKRNCGSHGECMYYVNSKDEEYCRCDQGWKGQFCHLISSTNLCNQTSCAPNSQCIILNEEKHKKDFAFGD
jgi:hypothetical protein